MSFWCREGQKENKVSNTNIIFTGSAAEKNQSKRGSWGGDVLFKRMASEGLTENEVDLQVKS